jgi:hypothetical protein
MGSLLMTSTANVKAFFKIPMKILHLRSDEGDLIDAAASIDLQRRYLINSLAWLSFQRIELTSPMPTMLYCRSCFAIRY